IKGMTVGLTIVHDRPSDLEVTLIGPQGAEAELSNLSGNNSVSAFNGIRTPGLWTLNVTDHKKRKE
ncbi:MAG: proprotein convertase P-domain-containing protein, partial [Pirellulaceae bacterium]